MVNGFLDKVDVEGLTSRFMNSLGGDSLVNPAKLPSLTSKRSLSWISNPEEHEGEP